MRGTVTVEFTLKQAEALRDALSRGLDEWEAEGYVTASHAEHRSGLQAWSLVHRAIEAVLAEQAAPAR